MFRRIVLAIGSAVDRGPLVAGAAQFASAGESVVLVTHIRKLAGTEAPLPDDEALVDLTAAEVRRSGLRAETEILEIAAERPVARALADVARGWRADLVVVGSRRLSDLQAALRGSVSHDLI